MKAGSLFIAVSLALSAVATNVQQDHRGSVNGGNRGGFGNNNNNGFFGQNNGRNGQNNQNQNNKGGNTGKSTGKTTAGKTTASSTAKGNQSNTSGKGGAASAASSSAAAAATTAAAASTGSSSTAAASNSTGTAATANNANAQDSLTLDPKVIATGFENNGQQVPAAGQVASLTSSNNFINFCLTVPNQPITNGQQIKTGSCNPAPMGSIPSVNDMPSAKFVVPANGDTLPANTAFTITMAIANMETGNFVNADENYFAAPQQLNGQGQIIGHSHVVVESLTSLGQTTPTNPQVFAFFKGLNAAAVNGQLTADVTAGLPAGFYKVSSINTAANHQPVLVPVAQHGSLDDVAYFTVSASGAAAASSAANSTAASGSAGSAAAASSAAASSAAAATSSAAATGAKGAAGAKGGAGAKGAAPAPPAGKGKAPAAPVASTPARVAQPAKKAPAPAPARGGRFNRRARALAQL
jgi:hypothetical protein